MWHLRGIFVSGTKLAIMYEIAVAVYMLLDIDKHVELVQQTFSEDGLVKGTPHSEQGKHLHICLGFLEDRGSSQ